MRPALQSLVYGFFLFCLCAVAGAQSFQIVPGQIDVVAAPGFSHAEVRVPITGTAGGFNFASLTANSDVAWVQPSIDTASHDVVLTFHTSTLTNSSNTATVTVTGSGSSDFFSVRASVAPLNITKLVDDPFRSRMYGVHQNGTNAGAVVVFDPLTNTNIACVTVGKKPTDLAVSPDGTELLVLNAAEGSYTAIDLATLQVKSTTAFGTYNNWGATDTTGDIAYGAGNIIYYTDGTWGPILYVYDRVTKQVLQQVVDDSYGVGDFALSPDGHALYLWQQYGWSAGYAGSNMARYIVAADGRLTFVERTSNGYPSGYLRDPLNTPVLIDSNATHVFAKQYAVNPSNVNEVLRTYPTDVYSISPGGEIAATNSAIFEVSTGTNLLSLPVTTSVQAITSDYARLVYFNATTRSLGSLDLIAAIGSKVLNRDLSPADGAITLSPDKLNWSAIPGIDKYRVYLGTSQAAVQNATEVSPAYLGEVTTPSFTLSQPLAAGVTYYWRVDAVSSAAVSPGVVFSFTVSPIGASLAKIDTATVQGHVAHQVDVALSSATPLAWQAQSNAAWVKFVSTTGTAPGTLSVVLDASGLTAGIHTANVTVKLGTGTVIFTLPVTLQVDPLNLTHMESDRTSSLVYAISEEASTDRTLKRAYLLEIDSATRKITRVVRAGSSVTDLAVHYGDGRIYVANWLVGALLAFDKTSLQQVQSYGFKAFTSTGYGEGDVYSVAAGAAGRVMVEEEDQWVDINIFDTTTGKSLKTQYEREGGGRYSPDGRYYYHGDNNSSGAELHQFDVTGDVFTELAHTRVTSVSYYGSRTVVVSENGERVFWNGAAFDKNLNVVWLIGDEIYSCSPDGRYAFSKTKIYDVNAKTTVLSMPATTAVSAYNGTSARLVVQSGSELKFFPIGGTTPFPAPILSVGAVSANSITLNWTDDSLESSFTLQKRQAGQTAWVDTVLAANITTYTFTGLAVEQGYEFRIKADSGAQTSAWSDVLSVATTPIVPPAVTTLDATLVSSYSANLRATVNPGGNTVNLSFEYGLDTNYGTAIDYYSSSYPYSNNLTGNSPITASVYLNGLDSNQTYHFRAVVRGAGLATVYGADSTFTTAVAPPGAPTITTISVSDITSTSAVVHARVNPNGSATSVAVEYGVQTSSAVSIGSGTTAVPVDITLTGLTPGSLYWYQLKATNTGGTSYGSYESFATLGADGGTSVLTAHGDSAFTVKNEACLISPTLNDVSSTNDPLTITMVGDASLGTVSLNGNNTVTYVPGPKFNGLDAFYYRVADLHGNVALAVVTVRSTFDAAAGTYVGAVGEVTGDFEHTGFIQLTVSRAGAVTGSVSVAGARYPIAARMRFDGVAVSTLRLYTRPPVIVAILFDPDADTLTGSVDNGSGSIPFTVARVLSSVQNPAPEQGRYTLLLPAEDSVSPTHGYGYGTATVGVAGTIRIAGRTGTGAPFTSASLVDGEGRFPLYAVPVQSPRSSFHGVISFREVAWTSDFDGQIGWSERNNPDVTSSTLIGSRYIAPGRGTLALPFADGTANARLDCWNGDEHVTPEPVTATLRSASLSSPDRRITSLAFAPKTGVFSGRIKLLGSRAASFRGVVFQAQGLGAGMVSVSGGTASVELVDPATMSTNVAASVNLPDAFTLSSLPSH